MAKPAKTSRSAKKSSARAKKTGKRGAKASAKTSASNRGAAKQAKRPAARTKPRAAGARAKAAPAAARRVLKPRKQPETLRCKSLSAALTADDVAASLKFYVDGVGFHVKQRWEKDGQLLGAELVAGSCMIGISQDDW